MSDKLAAQKGLKPLGIFRGFVSAGWRARRDGGRSGLRRAAASQTTRLTIDDIDLWELNEAFAVQVIYCRDKLGIDPEKLNVERRFDRGWSSPMA